MSAVPTPGEKKALFFLSLVAVFGAAARLVAANGVPVPDSSDVRALDRQIQAVDSVRREGRDEGGERRGNRAKRSQDTAAAGPTVPPPPSTLYPPQRLRGSTLDVDLASAAQLESLPGIGPALASRIVAARDSSGPFGSIEELRRRVRGIGPRLVKRLSPSVTFSGPRRPSSAERTEPFGNGGAAAHAKRQQGR